MKNKKGFTLIELLAVIVILAIIALIATPIVLKIISNSKESSEERSAELYIDALEKAIAHKNLKEEFNPNKCNIVSGKTICDGKEIKVKIKGEIPVKGSIKLENGKIVSNTLSYEKIKTPESFSKDDWKTIVENVENGNISKYNVGDTKQITLTGDINGIYTVRIANISTPEECNQEGFSQTACGFVIEFVDLIKSYVMNSINTNVGGWRDSKMRTYVNNTIYNSLPTEVKNGIIKTKVVSGLGKSITVNFITEDNLYLLSTKEVYGTAHTYDTVNQETRQLDYYKNNNVTTINYSEAIKQYYQRNTWWLRSATFNFDGFYFVSASGGWNVTRSTASGGVAPTFRIG